MKSKLNTFRFRQMSLVYGMLIYKIVTKKRLFLTSEPVNFKRPDNIVFIYFILKLQSNKQLAFLIEEKPEVVLSLRKNY